jgi:hypothetical protein
MSLIKFPAGCFDVADRFNFASLTLLFLIAVTETAVFNYFFSIYFFADVSFHVLVVIARESLLL